ncbi:Mif2/CENP-C like-domain-containing protein [Lipomyces kononenkoae]|uniref:Mif2/CENP-C like-domain-containing protein n=1 Tax=Lipomyces kononenkoae TaxID=34357 RepID=A0ACC3T9J4_LIPKO
MESIDAFFSPAATMATAAPTASFDIHAENTRTLDSETSMDITTSRSRAESPAASLPARGLPSPGILPRRTPVKTNIGSPARRSDIARKLDFGNMRLDEGIETAAESILMPESIRGKQRGSASRNWKSKKPYAIADYDVLEDEGHASDSASEADPALHDAEIGYDDVDDKREKENQAPDEIDAKMRRYKEFQEQEKRESEERLKQITDQVTKQSQANSEAIQKSVLQVHNMNLQADSRTAVRKRTIPSPSPQPESESAVDDDDGDVDIPSEPSELEIELDDEEFVKPRAKKNVVNKKSAPSKKPLAKPKAVANKVAFKPPAAKSKPKAIARPNQLTSASQPATGARQAPEPRTLSQNIQRIVPEQPVGSDDEEDGLRRSKRVRVQPLAYWRNERIIYNLGERRESGPALPQIKEIILIDSPQSTNTAKPSTRGKSRQGSVSTRRRSEDELSDIENNSEPDEVVGEVNDFMDDEKIVKRRLAVSGHSIPFLQTASSSFKFAKTFDEPGGFMASGMVLLPVHGEKGSRPSRHNALAFCVVEGHVEVTIQDTVFRLRRGGHTIVPRGNYYSLRNVGSKKAMLFFTQSTDTLFNASQEEDGED